MNTVANLPARLEAVFGRDRVRASESELRKFAIAGRVPLAVLTPQNANEVAETVRFAASEELALVCRGSGSKLEIGMPPERYDLALDMTGLREIAHYDPADLTLSADAGLPLGTLQMKLKEKGQFLPLAVPCLECSTVGGTIVSGIDSTLRQQYGTARDFLIGAEFVDGKGNLCKSGGRVVKNVTGYDLHKLLIGSLGTLAAVTRLNFRTFPLPEAFTAHLASFSDAESAMNYRAALLQSGLLLSNLEVVSPEFSTLASALLKAAKQPIPEPLSTRYWNVYAAYEGNEAVVRRITRELKGYSSTAQAKRSETLPTSDDEGVGDFLQVPYSYLTWASPNVVLMRVVLPHFSARDVIELSRPAQGGSLRCAFALRACGVANLALLAEGEDAAVADALSRAAADVFSRIAEKRGTATLLHAPLAVKERVGVWGAKPPDFPLMQRVKRAFDPQNIFAPGRFVGGL